MQRLSQLGPTNFLENIMATNADVVGAYLEKVRPKLQPLMEMTGTIGQKIKKGGEQHKISTWSQTLSSGQTLAAFRVQLQRYEGGDYGTYDPNGGDLGSGSMTRVDFMSMGHFPDRVAIQIPLLAAQSSASSEQSVIDVVKYQLKMALKTYGVYYDTGIAQDGTGVLATANGTGSPATTNPTYNLEANYGAQLLRRNQTVDIYDSTLASKKKAGVRIATMSPGSKTCSITAAASDGAAYANTDVIAFAGMTPTLAVGSWRNGIQTFNNSATSGYTLGLDRSVVDGLVSQSYAAGGAKLNADMFLLLSDLRTQVRDEEELAGTEGIAHMSQRASWYKEGQIISEWYRGNADKMPDLVPKEIKHDTTFQAAGVVHTVWKKQRRDRIDWFIPKNYCRAVLHDATYYQTPEGQKFFTLRNSTTANPAAGFQAFVIADDNLVDVDPGAGAFISGLQILSGY